MLIMTHGRCGDAAVSTIMPIFNGIETIDRAVSSLLRQDLLGWELIAIDDGSTDGSYERMRDWSKRDPRIRTFRVEENRGPGAARNNAIRQASGKMLAYLDCDDEF